MNKEQLMDIFSHLDSNQAWSLQLLQINYLKTAGTTYFSREITLSPEGILIQFIKQLSADYSSKTGIIDEYESVDLYTGDITGKHIYKINTSDDLIAPEYQQLSQAISSPDRETNLCPEKANAYLLKGMVPKDGSQIPVKLISMKKPLSVFTNRFLLVPTGKYHAITDNVLTLRKNIDAAIIGDNFYMFSLAAEKLFNMERSYRTKCESIVEEIITYPFISNPDQFKINATAGHNPRRFVSFNRSRLDALRNKNTRRQLAIKFGFTMDGSKIDTNNATTTERLVKFICNKGMIDPIDESPVEVANAKSWQ